MYLNIHTVLVQKHKLIAGTYYSVLVWGSGIAKGEERGKRSP